MAFEVVAATTTPTNDKFDMSKSEHSTSTDCNGNVNTKNNNPSTSFKNLLGQWNVRDKNSKGATPFIARISARKGKKAGDGLDADDVVKAALDINAEPDKQQQQQQQQQRKRNDSIVKKIRQKTKSIVLGGKKAIGYKVKGETVDDSLHSSGEVTASESFSFDSPVPKVKDTVSRFNQVGKQKSVINYDAFTSSTVVMKNPQPTRRLKAETGSVAEEEAAAVAAAAAVVFTTEGTTTSSRAKLMRRNSNKMKKRPVQMENVYGVPLEVVDTFFEVPEYEKNEKDTDLIRNAIENNLVFGGLDDAKLDSFVKAFHSFEVPKDEVIISQGEAGDYFYVLASGKVNFKVNGKIVGSATNGSAFGELALLYSCPRAATVIADKACTLFRVDPKSFRHLLQSQTKKSQQDKEQLLKNVNFVKILNDRLDIHDMRRLTSVMTPRIYEAGDYFYKKGQSDADAFYIIQEGQVRVTDCSLGSSVYEDITLGPGAHFGERALVTDLPREANVTAINKVTVFSINKAMFTKIFKYSYKEILKSRDKIRLESIKYFKEASLGSDKMDTLTNAVADKAFANGDAILEEGQETKAALYLVRDGKVKITNKEGTISEIISIGGYFGQEQLLADARGNTLGEDSSSSVVSEYSAHAVDDHTVCGLLTLEECRKVFDTKAIDDFFFHFGTKVLDKKSSLRSSVQMNLSLDDFSRHSMLGEGQFGEVWLVSAQLPDYSDDERDDEDILDGSSQEFALKIQQKDDGLRTDAFRAIKRELAVMQQLHHPFIADLVHSYENEDSVFMLMSVVKGCELWNVIHQEDAEGNWSSGIVEKHAKFYGLVIADALAYMHREKFVFRDLKPENVLIGNTGYPIIVDFGFAKYCPDKTFTFCGTPNYLAPEIVTNRGHGAAADHWALGVVIYEMISGENPFYDEDMDQMTLFKSIVDEKYYPLPEDTTPEAVDLVAELLKKNPDERCGLDDASREKYILSHDWFQELDLAKLHNMQVEAPWIPPPDLFDES